MRRFVMLILLLGLAGCQIGSGLGKSKPAPNALTGGEIEVTALDGGPKPVPPSKLGQVIPSVATPVAADAKTPPAAGPDPAKAKPAKTGATLADAVKSDPRAPDPEAVPVKPKLPQQIACEKKGGNWGVAGKSGANTCIKSTGEGAKQCERQTDCKGSCLARSGTCAPYTPLFGCNEILQADGSRVTLCID